MEISSNMFLVLSVLAIIGSVALILVVIEFLKFLHSIFVDKIKVNCYQCGDDSIKKIKYKTGYYCAYCIEAGLAKENEDYKENNRLKNI